MEEEGWGIINGMKEGDEEGEVIFTGRRGETVINYVLGDKGTWQNVERMEVGDEMESNYRSVSICMEKRRGRKEKRNG